MRKGAESRARYRAPEEIRTCLLQEVIRSSGRSVSNDKQFDLLRSYGTRDAHVFYTGDLSLLNRPVVSVVGTREATDNGWKRASRLGRELAENKIVVMSGLAKGVDTAALTSAIEAGGKTVGVIGTPLDKAYPIENAELQENIYRDHLLISPFRSGETVHKSNFPKRNRVMALLSDATVIVEASDTSGTLHQAAECLRQGRWLFIVKSIANDDRLQWPSRFIGKPKVQILESTADIMTVLR